MKNRKAFSIAEIGVILLIISILFAAITEGTNLYRKSKLASARNLTQNSPVIYYEGLTLWFDTTSKDSFDDETPGNGDLIRNWHSINPIASPKNRFTVTQSANDDYRPTYDSGAINGLPGLYFNSDHLAKTNVPLSDFASSNESTIFIVQSKSSQGTPFSWGGMPRVLFHTPIAGNFYYIFENTANDGVVLLSAPTMPDSDQIIVGIKNSTGLIARANGSQIGTDASTQSIVESTTGLFIIGANSIANDNQFVGNIGEIIMFNRQLSDDEISSVENYLSQKWKIALN